MMTGKAATNEYAIATVLNARKNADFLQSAKVENLAAIASLLQAG